MDESSEMLPLASTDQGRALSEYELHITRSLQKLDLPDWYKNYSLNHSQHRSSEWMLSLKRKPSRPRWAELRQRSTSTSSLPVVRRSSTPASLIGKRVSTPNWLYHTQTSPNSTAASSPFSKNSKDECGNHFQYSTPVSSRCSSPFSSLGGFAYPQPYTGWRSSERLARESSANDDDVSSYDSCSSFYLSPEERLSHGPGYHAMKFGIHPSLFYRSGSQNFNEEQVQTLPTFTSSCYQQRDKPPEQSYSESLVELSTGNDPLKPELTVASLTQQIDRLTMNDGKSPVDKQLETLTVFSPIPASVPLHINKLYCEQNDNVMEPLKNSLFKPWSCNIGEITLPKLFPEPTKAISDKEWALGLPLDNQSSTSREELNSVSPIPNISTSDEFKPFDFCIRTQVPPEITKVTTPNKSSLVLPLTSETLGTQTYSSKTSPDDYDSNYSEYSSNNNNNESSSSSSEVPIVLPKLLLSPKATNTTVTRSNGRITEIVEISTEELFTASSHKPDMLQPLHVTLSSVSPSSVSPSSELSSLFGSCTSSSNRPATTPLTTTTFITTYHRDSVLSPTQQPTDSELFSGPTRTLTLINDDNFETSPKRDTSHSNALYNQPRYNEM